MAPPKTSTVELWHAAHNPHTYRRTHYGKPIALTPLGTPTSVTPTGMRSVRRQNSGTPTGSRFEEARLGLGNGTPPVGARSGIQSEEHDEHERPISTERDAELGTGNGAGGDEEPKKRRINVMSKVRLKVSAQIRHFRRTLAMA
jgi:hypothetical protein